MARRVYLISAAIFLSFPPRYVFFFSNFILSFFVFTSDISDLTNEPIMSRVYLEVDIEVEVDTSHILSFLEFS